MRTRVVDLAVHRWFGVLLTVAALAGGAAIHAAPANAQAPPPSGYPQETGSELPPYNCGGCSLPAPDSDWDDDGLANSSERGTGYRPPASREEWYQRCRTNLGETQCREGAARYDPYNPPGYATDPRDPDTDSDGLLDGFEVRQRYEYPRYGNRLRDRTSPTVWDTDSDGYSDGLEVKYTRTNPVKWDSDSDGLSDGSEGKTHRTNPNKYDTDGDCMADGAEVRAGTDPRTRSTVRPLNCRRPKKLLRRVKVLQPTPAPLPQPR
jgi:hypothetical protein